VDTLRGFDAAALGLLPIGFGLAAGALGLPVAFGLLALGLLALGLLAFGLLALGLLALGCVVLVLAAGRCLAVVDALRLVLLAGAAEDAVRDLLALAGVAAGLAVDMVLAAAVSALDAALIALVAVFIAASALDMVFADAVALVAADVIFVAAEVTLAAADDTVLAAATCAVARGAEDLVRVDMVRAARRDRFVAAVFVVALDFGLVPARLTTALLRALDRAVFAAPRRAGLRAVVCRGIDLPP
jgi:hypothetical protein